MLPCVVIRTRNLEFSRCPSGVWLSARWHALRIHYVFEFLVVESCLLYHDFGMAYCADVVIMACLAAMAHAIRMRMRAHACMFLWHPDLHVRFLVQLLFGWVGVQSQSHGHEVCDFG